MDARRGGDPALIDLIALPLADAEAHFFFSSPETSSTFSSHLLPVLLRRDEPGEEARVVEHLQLAEDVHVRRVGHGATVQGRRRGNVFRGMWEILQVTFLPPSLFCPPSSSLSQSIFPRREETDPSLSLNTFPPCSQYFGSRCGSGAAPPPPSLLTETCDAKTAHRPPPPRASRLEGVSRSCSRTPD